LLAGLFPPLFFYSCYLRLNLQRRDKIQGTLNKYSATHMEVCRYNHKFLEFYLHKFLIKENFFTTSSRPWEAERSGADSSLCQHRADVAPTPTKISRYFAATGILTTHGYGRYSQAHPDFDFDLLCVQDRLFKKKNFFIICFRTCQKSPPTFCKLISRPPHLTYTRDAYFELNPEDSYSGERKVSIHSGP
jgi:hypothetical protein